MWHDVSNAMIKFQSISEYDWLEITSMKSPSKSVKFGINLSYDVYHYRLDLIVISHNLYILQHLSLDREMLGINDSPFTY